MEVIRTIAEVRARCDAARAHGSRVALVPTMGALHAGHEALLADARRRADLVVMSLFVNPLQFGDAADLAAYPRDEVADAAVAERLGVDVLFAPDAREMYPSGEPLVTVDPGPLGTRLEGASRPGHFRGVATVVAKLLHAVGPCVAVFGEKDAQQLAVIQRMVGDLNLPVAIVPVETVRESDGLALSSRNLRLDAEGRRIAVSLFAALKTAQDLIATGRRDVSGIRQLATAMIPTNERLRLEYLEIVDPDSMEPVETVTSPVLAAGALWVGSTRLIDNLLCTTPIR